MADFNYSGIAATSKRLVERFGRTIDVVQLSTTLKDVARPELGVDEALATTVTAKAAIFEDATFDGFGTMVHRKNVGMVVIAHSSLPPGTDLETYDSITDGGKPRKILRRLPLAPGDTTLAWLLEVAR